MSSNIIDQQPDPFSTTNWSLIRQLDGDMRASALAVLCERYWLPIFAYVRRRFRSDQDACEMTQEFFTWLLEKDIFRRAAPDRGRLRTFLLTSLRNFLIKSYEAKNALKRGGGWMRMDLHSPEGQAVLARLKSVESTADQAFERTWALMLIERASERVEREMELAGQGPRFRALRPMLDGTRGEAGYREIADQLHISEAAARQAAGRLRRRFREMLIDEIQLTVSDPADVQDEIQRLFLALQTL